MGQEAQSILPSPIPDVVRKPIGRTLTLQKLDKFQPGSFLTLSSFNHLNFYKATL
jgi:hypothetical protein